MLADRSTSTPSRTARSGRRLAAVQSQGGDVTAVIIHEADQIGVAPCQPEGHDVALPQLVGTRALEEAGFGRILLGLSLRRRGQPLLAEGFVNARWTGLDQEKAAQYV